METRKERWQGLSHSSSQHSEIPTLFAEQDEELPASLHSILPGRLTKMVFSENGEQAEDESLWTRRGTASKNMGKEWLGESWFLVKEDEEDETAEEIDERELMPAGMVNAEATQEESLRLLGKGERREKGDAESDGYEPSIASTEDLEKAMDVGEPEMHKASIEAPPQPSAKGREEHRLHHAHFEAWRNVCKDKAKTSTRSAKRNQKNTSSNQTIYSSTRLDTSLTRRPD